LLRCIQSLFLSDEAIEGEKKIALPTVSKYAYQRAGQMVYPAHRAAPVWGKTGSARVHLSSLGVT
jgi:hypothetical protein